MSRLVIVVGLPDNKPTSVPTLVYIGRNASEAIQAQAKSASPRFLLIPHASGIPKNNPNASANAAAELLSRNASIEASADLRAELDVAKANNMELIRSHSEELAFVKEQLASLTAANAELSRANESLAAANAIAANEVSTLRRQVDALLATGPEAALSEVASEPAPAAEEPAATRRRK